MPLDQISRIFIGAADGKYEYVADPALGGHYDTFVRPKTINEGELLSGRTFLVRGFRGTGKTSLLRWLAAKLKAEGRVGEIILFKTDVSEGRRVEMSKAVGIKDIVEVDSQKMGITQDYKEAWRWFLHKTIAESVLKEKLVVDDGNFEKYIDLVGLGEKSWFEKAIAGIPKFESARIRIKGMLEFIVSELEIEGKGTNQSVAAVTAIEKLDYRLAHLKLTKPVFVCLDELEVFYSTKEQYSRDLSMVRDLLFTIANMNQKFRDRGLPIQLYGGVRTEVLDAIGSSGQEVQRLVGDCGVTIAWHHEKRGLNHPLFDIIRRKIWSSETANGLILTPDPIRYYFPDKINGFTLDEYILDRSLYKPRDIVQRLKCVQSYDPLQSIFSAAAFQSTEKEYSSLLWGEITYELSATYSPEQISTIEGLFIAKEPYFNEFGFSARLRDLSRNNRAAETLVHDNGGPNTLLRNLYRIGAIGNAATSGSIIRQRWVFRGDPHLDLGSPMRLHPAFSSHLSVRHTKKRTENRSGQRPNARRSHSRPSKTES